MQHECDTCNTSATRVRHEQHECYTNHTSATRVKNFDFDNYTGKNILSHPYIFYMSSERLQGEEQFHTKNCLLEMSLFHSKMRLKSAPKKLNFLTAKAISKSCTLDCSCKCPCSCIVTHSKAASFSIKTILCKNTNILFSKNY